MTDPCESIRPHCQLCHQLIHDVAYLTFGARTPATSFHQEEPATWELFITWIGCGDCTELLQGCCRNEVLLRTYHLRKPEDPLDIRSLNYYRYQFSHFSVPAGNRDVRLTWEEWIKGKRVAVGN